MKTIPLTQGLVAQVDDSDFESVAKFKWYANRRGRGRTFYAQRSVKQSSGKWKIVGLHNFLMSNARRVDHKDGNGLNNRRRNLRVATHRQNMQNTRLRCDNRSGFKGVTSNGSGWKANITVEGVRKYLGTCPTKLEAAALYDSAARACFGVFARPNL